MLVGVALLPPSLIPALWNIGILLHKQAKRRTIMRTTVGTLAAVLQIADSRSISMGCLNQVDIKRRSLT